MSARFQPTEDCLDGHLEARTSEFAFKLRTRPVGIMLDENGEPPLPRPSKASISGWPLPMCTVTAMLSWFIRS